MAEKIKNNGSKNFIGRTVDSYLKIWHTIRRAYEEFLTVPTIVIFCFLLIAAGTYILDRTQADWIYPLRHLMKSSIFAEPKATSNLLSAIAASLITVSSLTVTLLLLVVQQTAASMTSQVFDQFLRSRHNQVYFGFFIGLALYALIVLATVSETFNPVIGATIAFILTVIALFLLIILIYTTIHEMRPAIIIEAIHDHIIESRARQLSVLSKTRRNSMFSGNTSSSVTALHHGYITHINFEAIAKEAAHAKGGAEVIFQVSMGDFIAFDDEVAMVKAATAEEAEKIVCIVQNAIQVERQRDIANDPGDGLQQLEMIAWTSISTAKSNPHPGLLTIRILRSLLAKWAGAKEPEEPAKYPIVYKDDLEEKLMDTLETLGVVSSESMQHQNFIEVIRTFTLLFSRLKPEQQARVEDIIMRLLSALGDLVLTKPLYKALDELTKMLSNQGRHNTAHAVKAAQQEMALSVGKLNSRSTRVGK